MFEEARYMMIASLLVFATIATGVVVSISSNEIECQETGELVTVPVVIGNAIYPQTIAESVCKPVNL